MLEKAILMIFCVGIATVSYLSIAVAVLLAWELFIREKKR
jgi:hypothetical protein